MEGGQGGILLSRLVALLNEFGFFFSFEVPARGLNWQRLVFRHPRCTWICVCIEYERVARM